jgi:CrcB protein
MIYFYIACGGALGAVLRFFISEQLAQWLGRGFPYGTLTVNVLGSFLLGLALAYSHQLPDNSDSFLKGFIMVGLLGALTTFSTFSMDSVQLMQSAQWLKAAANITLNLVCCLTVTGIAYTWMKG